MRQIFKRLERGGELSAYPDLHLFCDFCDCPIETGAVYYVVKSVIGPGLPANYQSIHETCRAGFERG